MSDSYVTSGAILRCSFGDKTAKLTVYPDRTVFLSEKPMANISDHVSLYNIAPFGKCRTTSYPPTGSATAANHGRLTPMPCVPGTVTDWINGKNDYIVKGKPALLKSSYCRCKWGGVITIVNDGQRDTGSADLSKENVMTEEEMKAKSEDNTGLNPDSVLDGIQMALDAAGFIPGVGAIPDLLNASISALRGDWATAGLSVLAAVPVVGDAAAAAKFARNGVKIAKGEAKMLQRGIPQDKINALYEKSVKTNGGTYQTAFGSDVLKIKLNENKRFVRVYNGSKSQKEGRWLMEEEEIEGLSPKEIKEKFALPEEPTHIVDVYVEKGSILRKSIAAENDMGKGGGIQYNFKDKQMTDIEYINERTIDKL